MNGELIQTLPIIAGAIAIMAVMVSGMHIATGLLSLGLIGIHFLLPRTIIGDAGYQAWISIDNATLSAVVLYVLMGEMLLHSGMGERAFGALDKLLAGLPGSLLHATIGFGGLFASVSGSSVASAALLGTVTVPPMDQRGYNRRLSYGAVAGGGTLGILIPPSIIMILYGYLGNVSIAALFMAGVVPGLILIGAFSGYIALRVMLKPSLGSAHDSKPTIATRISALPDLIPLVVLALIVFVGIYTGVWTPTEAAAGGCVATLAFLVSYRKFTLFTLQKALQGTLLTSSMIFMILVGSSIIAYVANFLAVPTTLVGLIEDSNWGRYEVLIACCAIFFLLGCFVDGLSITIITVPIILPIMTSVGFDPVWFGVVFTILIEVSLITPPLGMNLFVINGVVPGSNFRDIVLGTAPYFMILLAMIGLLALSPDIALWLPGQLR